MTTTPIKIIDKPCGIEMTTAMINSFKEEEKWIDFRKLNVQLIS